MPFTGSVRNYLRRNHIDINLIFAIKMWINIAFVICLATVSYSRTLISSSQVQVPRHNPSEDDLATVSDVQTFVSSDQMQIPDRSTSKSERMLIDN